MEDMQRSEESIFSQNFNFVWDIVIEPIIQRVNKEVDPEFRKKAQFSLAYEDIDAYKEELKEFYHEKRQWLKRVYLPHEKDPRLDTHKLGAALCRSLIAKKPFFFNYSSAEKFVQKKFEGTKTNNIEWFVGNVYANYKVAFYASVGMVFIELLYKYKKQGKNEAFDLFCNNEGLFFYPKSENHDSFENSCILALQKNDVLMRNFDYLSYAVMLFQLEQFNMQWKLLGEQKNIIQKLGVNVELVEADLKKQSG